MIWVWILIGFVVGEGSMAGVWYWMEKKRKRQKEVQDKGRVVIPLRDMVQLANMNFLLPCPCRGVIKPAAISAIWGWSIK